MDCGTIRVCEHSTVENMCTPGRPVPVFEEETFSARKRTPFRAQYTPRSPAKSCPPVSRLARSPEYYSGNRPQFVSFKSERKISVSSPYYSPSHHGSYFEQCFEVIEKIGEGSFGEVFKVRSHDNGRLYAVKRCWERFRGSHDRQLKLEEVARHETLAHHPNCLRFINAWEERGLLYIQTELCLMSLSEYADLNGRIPEDKVWKILVDLLQGLAHLHNHRLGHFDIKPSNIFIGTDGTCKLGDFGLCLSLDQGMENAMEGDAKYMARELISGHFSKAADIFSLGISMLEIACDLELPSGDNNWHRLRDGVLPHDFTKDLSPQLTELLCQMMDPQPDHRPTASNLLQHKKINLIIWKSYCKKKANSICHIIQSIIQPIYRLLIILVISLVWWRRETKQPSPSPSPTLPSSLSNVPFIGAADDTFSDDDESGTEDTQDISQHRSQLNCSYVSTSPVRYPGYFYSGPPIPLNLEEIDSSLDDSICGKTDDIPEESSSQNSSFSCTPNSKPLLNDQILLRGSADRSSSVGPKNLLEMFGEVGD